MQSAHVVVQLALHVLLRQSVGVWSSAVCYGCLSDWAVKTSPCCKNAQLLPFRNVLQPAGTCGT